MKILYGILLSLISVSSAFGQTVTSTSNANSASGSQSGNSFDQNFTTQAPDLGRTVPSVIPPSLTSSIAEVCMGSTSAGVTVVGVGASLGTTWVNEACERRMDARQVALIGEKDIALEIMCGSDRVLEAAIRAGKPCRASGGPNPALAKVVAPYRPVVQRPIIVAPVVVGLSPSERKRKIDAWEIDQRQRARY